MEKETRLLKKRALLENLRIENQRSIMYVALL